MREIEMIRERTNQGFIREIVIGMFLWWLPATSPAQQIFHSPKAMVVCAESLATRTGVKILQKGGNAIDAAIASGFALAVTFPEAGNIGGGGFAVIRFHDGKTTSFDFRETAPARAMTILSGPAWTWTLPKSFRKASDFA